MSESLTQVLVEKVIADTGSYMQLNNHAKRYMAGVHPCKDVEPITWGYFFHVVRGAVTTVHNRERMSLMPWQLNEAVKDVMLHYIKPHEERIEREKVQQDKVGNVG